ncbi:FAD binding domain-containing protein [uncultured Trichococcus sp.]|uniref:FAD binding domain-containing protein n=1 Tax=uncultured Trichococcus sp. TaxID=189665 RepID=UPI002A189FAA|nr:FAD binding domain-containing protein [uncultured Trichococcus sp.]
MVKVFIPKTLAEALSIRTLHKTLVINGGTDVMVKFRRWSGMPPDFPLDVLHIGNLAELKHIEIAEGNLMIGAAVTLSELLEHPMVPDYIKLPIREMASPAIRNMATLAGNLCNASASGDSLPMLYALDAEVKLVSTAGTRKLPVRQFIIFAKQTLLQPDELVTEITIPLADYTASYYRKIGGRKANAISKASFYAVAIKKDSIIEDVRIAFGSVAPMAVRDRACEEILLGTAETELAAKIETVRTRYGELLAPLDDSRSTADYRRHVSLQLLEDFVGRGLAT